MNFTVTVCSFVSTFFSLFHLFPLDRTKLETTYSLCCQISQLTCHITLAAFSRNTYLLFLFIT